MTERPGAAARAYHDATKHSQESLHRNPHYLDFENQPLPFKIYSTLEPLPLPPEHPPIETPALQALARIAEQEVGTDEEPSQAPDLAALARVLFFSAGITKKKSYPGGEMYFRAAPNTGALYHIDLYLVCGELPGLEAGVYHFGPQDFALRRLRAADCRAVLVEATGGEPSIARAPAILVSASTYWRNAWKYQARAYRHCFWDAGTLHANLLAIATSEELRPRITTGFADAPVERLLGLDPAREGALTLVALGRGGESPPAVAELPDLELETTPLSHTEVDYPDIRAMQASSSLASGKDAAAWRAASVVGSTAPVEGRSIPLTPIPDDRLPPESIGHVIRRRGSTRAFDPDASISVEQLATVLDRASVPLPGDLGGPLVDLYLIVHAVDGLAPGAYVHHPDSRSLELIREGEFRGAAGRLGLFQELPADAAVNVYSLADLDAVLGARGDRGYRAAQLEGGIRGGLMYLTAYALRFGATGLTFLDDEVTEFFEPHARGKSVMFLTALGRSVRRG